MMKILMIGMDPQLNDPTSETGKRIDFYRQAVGEIFVIVLESYGKSFLGKVLAFFKAWQKSRLMLKKQPFDIVSAQDPFMTGLVGYFLKLEFGICLQLQIHTGIFEPFFLRESLKNKLFFLLSKFLISSADCVKVVSEHIRDYLVKDLKISDNRIYVLPVYLSLDDYINGSVRTDLKKKYPQFEFIVLMASRLVRQKQISLAIEAVGGLVKKYPKIGLIIMGSGPDEARLKRISADSRLEKNVVFEPWTNDLVSYYKTADVFLLTSIYEGWARTVVEAMASGLPVIMTDVGVAGEVVKNGKNGIVVPIGDESAIVEAIERLYLNPQERKMLVASAKETIDNFSLRNPQEYLRRFRESFLICKKK